MLLLDEKPAEEFQINNIPGSINIPADNIADLIDTLKRLGGDERSNDYLIPARGIAYR